MSASDRAEVGLASPGPAATLPLRLREAMVRGPDRIAVRARLRGGWADTTYAELWRAFGEVALGLRMLGVTCGDRVVIVGGARYEAFVTALATIACRAVCVPLYSTLPFPVLRSLVWHCAPKVAMVESGPPLAAFLEAVRELGEKPTVVSYGQGIPGPGGVVRALSSVQADGRRRLECSEGAFEELLVSASPRDDVTIAYTAGTTGPPRGAVFTHEHITGLDLEGLFGPVGSEDAALFQIPFPHVFGRFACYSFLCAGATVAFGAEREEIGEVLAEVRPTHVFALPDVLEHFHQRLLDEAARRSARSRRIFECAVARARKAAETGARPGFLADRFVARRIRKRFGGRLRVFYVSGVTQGDVLRFFLDAGVPVHEGYGLTEIPRPLAFNRPDRGGERNFKVGTAGRPAPGVEVRIAEDGEILVDGPRLPRTYWRDEGALAQALAPGGAFKTGDVGRFDAEGFLVVEDRRSSLFRLSDGTLVAPLALERRLAESPLIDQAVLFGRDRPYTAALLIPNLDALTRFAERRGFGRLGRVDLLSNSRVAELVVAELEPLLETMPERLRPRRFRMLSMAFSEASGELTPTLGLRRRVLEEKYKLQIDALYGEKADAPVVPVRTGP